MENNKVENIVKTISIGFNAIPIVGGVMAGVADEVISRRKNKRLEEFLLQLGNDIKEVEKGLNQGFLMSDEMYDIIEDTFTKVSDTRQQEKIDAYRAVFMNTILSNDPIIDETLEINELIHNWFPRHILLLKVLNDPVGIDKQMGEPVGIGGGFSTSLLAILEKLFPRWGEDQIERTWKDLYDKHIHSTPGIKTMITDQGINQLKNRLSTYGQHVAIYLIY